MVNEESQPRESKIEENQHKANTVEASEIGETPVIDMDEEYKKTFSHAMLTDKLMKVALEYITNLNPTTVILTNADPEDSETRERVKAQMQEWMGTFEAVLKEGRSLPVDIIGMAADIARKRRNTLK